VKLQFENTNSGERFRVTLKENEFPQGKSVCECLIEVLRGEGSQRESKGGRARLDSI